MQAEHWAKLYSDTDELTGGWLRHGAQLLHDCTSAAEAAPAAAQAASAAAGKRNAPLPQAPAHVANILVSAGQLVATLGKLMLFHLDSYFPIESRHPPHSQSGDAHHALTRRFIIQVGQKC